MILVGRIVSNMFKMPGIGRKRGFGSKNTYERRMSRLFLSERNRLRMRSTLLSLNLQHFLPGRFVSHGCKINTAGTWRLGNNQCDACAEEHENMCYVTDAKHNSTSMNGVRRFRQGR